MKRSAWLILTLCFFASASFIMCGNANGQNEENNKEQQAAFARLKAKADSARAYSKAKGFSLEYCFLVDFSIHSGKDRFFVWDFAKDTIKYSGLCCHGYGQRSTQIQPVFSNIEGSYCSSLGRYKVGERSYSQWGINVHYKLHGLDRSNNNAFRRWVVLHSHNPVSDTEIYPKHLPLGWSQGCPVLSNNMMRKIDQLMKESKKPVLLWVYI